MTNSADPDQLADLDLHCLQRVCLGSAGQGLMTNSADPDQLASSEAN